jgi:hypothetical protein
MLLFALLWPLLLVVVLASCIYLTGLAAMWVMRQRWWYD